MFCWKTGHCTFKEKLWQLCLGPSYTSVLFPHNFFTNNVHQSCCNFVMKQNYMQGKAAPGKLQRALSNKYFSIGLFSSHYCCVSSHYFCRYLKKLPRVSVPFIGSWKFCKTSFIYVVNMLFSCSKELAVCMWLNVDQHLLKKV